MAKRSRLSETPRYDALLAELRRCTEPRGAKTDLARFCSKERDQPVNYWRGRVRKLLDKTVLPNAEDVLCLVEWLQMQRSAGPLTRATRRDS